jgi:lysophospholipase L1-like esterase
MSSGAKQFGIWVAGRPGLALLVLVGLSACGDRDAAAKPTARRLPKVFIIGDSTVKSTTKGEQGWGDPLPRHFDKDRITVVNRARGGRSSRTFMAEGLWAKVLAELQAGDFVLIQFGHNDGGAIVEGGRASLPGTGDETRAVVHRKTGEKEVVHTYGWYVRKYVADARAKGATPIVLSPVPRNLWRKGKVVRAARDYGKWAADAAKTGGAFFIDLNDLVARRYEEAGPRKVKDMYFGKDHTHTTPAGADLTAAVVAEALKGLKGCPLGGYLSRTADPKK